MKRTVISVHVYFDFANRFGMLLLLNASLSDNGPAIWTTGV